MSSGFILKGSEEALKGTQVLAIVASCTYAGIPLIRKVDDGNCCTGKRCTTPPVANNDGFRLTLAGPSKDNKCCCVSSTNAALRFVASYSPSSNLCGETIAEQAIVDSWLSFGWSSLDLPIEVLKKSDGKGDKADLDQALSQLDQHLTTNTYIAGGSAATIADIRLLVSVYNAENEKLWSPAESQLVNLKRWYQTMANQEWFVKSKDMLSSLDAATATTTALAPSAAAPPVAGGVMLNGHPPIVENKKYRRNRIRIKEVIGSDGGKTFVGKTITVAGWSRTIRKASSKLFFIELNDGSTGVSLQCVLDIQTTEGFEECKTNGGTGSSFQFEGVVVESQGGEQVVDMQVTKAKLLGAVFGGNPEGTVVGGMLYPMSKKEHTLEHMRDHAHLRARGSIHAAAMRIRHAMAYATHTFFHNHGFLYIHTPILTGADCEGAGEQFGVTTLLGSDHLKPGIELPVHQPPEEKKMSKSEMKRQMKKKGKEDPNKPVEEIVVGAVDYSQDFFAQRVNLTVSGQLNVETHACALSDVYTFGPTFRAEESRTYRHLSEFWMIEPEIAFADLSDDIDLAEDYLKYCVKFALENCADDLEFFENSPHGEKGLRDRLRNVLENEFKRLTYTEAIEILKKAVEDGAEFEVKPEWGIDLPSEHERYICEKVFKQPVVLTNYPKEIKAFYMKLNDDGKTVAAADVLVPKIGEMIGGSQREHRYEVLKTRCSEMGLDPRSVWWYLDLRRYGTVPHAGFGLGFERLILFITGLDNIRDVIPFPRWVGNAKF